MAQLSDCMNLKMANPAAEFSLNAPPRIEVIWNVREVHIVKLRPWPDLSVKAGVWEAKEEARKYSQILVRRDVSSVRLRGLAQRSFKGEIQKHEEVAYHADDEAEDDDGISAFLGGEMSQKSEQCPTRDLPHGYEDRTQGGQGFSVRSKCLGEADRGRVDSWPDAELEAGVEEGDAEQ